LHESTYSNFRLEKAEYANELDFIKSSLSGSI